MQFKTLLGKSFKAVD